MKVAFTLFADRGWTGGIHYLLNLFSALAELPGRPVQPLLFAGLGADLETLRLFSSYLSEPPILSPLWTPGTPEMRRRALRSLLLQRDLDAEKAFREANVDLVFHHRAWYGIRFQLPTLAWIADFQHHHLPIMFSRKNYWKREIGYWVLGHSATRILLSSQDAAKDCQRLYHVPSRRIAVCPFAIDLGPTTPAAELQQVREKYHLPENFFYLPNQFWKHKNHFVVVDALRILKLRGDSVAIAVSGNPQDIRHPDHPRQVMDAVAAYDLQDSFRLLGMIPRQDVKVLMRLSIAVINPSLFEGWSTVVEEAKALGVPMLLSDLDVHREQAPDCARFFSPDRPEELADLLVSVQCDWLPGPRIEAEAQAETLNRFRRIEFARSFAEIAHETVKHKH